MPYTPDATDVANPVAGTVKAATAAAEFIAIKLYMRDVLLAGMNSKAPLASPSFTGLGTVSALSNGATLELMRLSNTGTGANTKAQLTFRAASTNYAQITGGYGASAPNLDFAVAAGGDHTFTNNGAIVAKIDSAGNVGIGGTANASAILDVQSTTKGLRLPNMTTAQKNAIASPAAGLLVFDTTLSRPCFYSGAAWVTL